MTTPKKTQKATTIETPQEAQEAQAEQVVLKVKRLHKDALLPQRMTSGAAGYDIAVYDYVTIHPKRIGVPQTMIKTGIALEIPKGYHAKVFLRSSIGLKTDIRLANGTGIIDSDYRGELKLIVENIGQYACFFNPGDRIAQLVIEKNTDVLLEEVDNLSETERGENGIGSTNNNNNNVNEK